MIPSLIVHGVKHRLSNLLRRSQNFALNDTISDSEDDNFEIERLEIVEEKLEKLEKQKDETLAVLSTVASEDKIEKILPPAPTEVNAVPKAPSVDRRSYLDGIRGIAMLMIWNHHYADHTWMGQHPNVLQYETFQYIVRHGQLALPLFFILSGRVILLNFYRNRHHNHISKWISISSANFRRLFRLGAPVIVVGFLQWQVCINGVIQTATEAEKYLKSGVLGTPYWCELNNFSGYLGFVVDIFSLHDPATLLARGSTLWCIYVVFWGSVYTYAVAMIANFIPRRRFLFYTILLVCLYYVQSANAFFIFGLLICDLDAMGVLKASKKFKWWKVLLSEIILIVAIFFILSFYEVAHALNDFTAGKSIANGAFASSTPSQFEFSRYPSWWIPSLCIMIYIELSPVTQWVLSSWVLRFFARASLGFFLLHMSLIYILMPHLILHFAKSYNFWNTIILTYIVSTIVLFVVSYIFHYTVERWSMKLALAVWNYLFVDGDVTISKFPAKFVKSTARALRAAPFVIPHWLSEKYTAFKSVSERPEGTKVRPPRDLELEKQENVDPSTLHSTYWCADVSDDPVARRTAFVLRLNSFLAPFHFLGILGLAITWFLLNPIGPWTEEQVLNFASLWKIVWLLSLPYVVITFVGYSTPRIAWKKEDMDKRPVQRDLIRYFYIVIVTKGSNPDAVRRGYNNMLPLEQLHPAVKVVVLTDEPYAYPDLNNIVCPADYKSEKGIAKHKARALDYFRKHVQLTQYDWILHMDEESTIDAESLRRCFDFIRYEKHHFGQGIIIYNAYKYWSNWFFTVADAIRVGDDLARFNLQYTVFHRPVFGAHGSFLMTNGHLENLVTWDFGTLAEDFEFSHKAWELGFTCGAVHGIVREQSPGSVRDFLKQRRRWYLGIRDIQGLYYLPQFAIKLWSTGVFCLIATIINIPLSLLIDGSATPIWIAVLSSFCFAVFYWLYLFGLIFQDLDYGTPWYLMIIRFFLGIILQPFCSMLEGAAVVWAMASEGVTKFEVIKK
ncbi:glycosyl transferase family group 2-domain-containing protein [Paraphysoderma sedebokerense]|nr:glycosyl transferase family group 2-domain-containing protein [Paraphysoderma sedebokerense]